MARVFTDPKETGSLSLTNDAWTGFTATPPTLETTHPRTGTYEYRFDGATQEGMHKQIYAANSDRTVTVQAYLYADTYPSADAAIMRIVLSGGADWVVMMSSTGTLFLALKIVGVYYQQGSASSAIGTGSYAGYVEFKIDTINDIMAVRWNGADVSGDQAIFSGNTFGGSGNAIELGLGIGGTSASGLIFMSDIVINDDQGSFQTGYPAGQDTLTIRPNAAGSNADWTRAGTDSGANWSQTEEIPPNDNTDYVTSSTSGETDDYNCGASGLTDEVIDVIDFGVRTRGQINHATLNADLVVRCTMGGTTEEGSNIAPTLATWYLNSESQPRSPTLILYDLPGASTTAITPSDIDSMEMGVRCTQTNTVYCAVTSILANVSHHAAAAVGRSFGYVVG